MMRRALCLLMAGCGAAAQSAPADVAPEANVAMTPADEPARLFRFTTLAGEEVDSASLAGRMTVVGFVATYDAASQAQARFLQAIHRRHVPRINVLLLVLEPAAHLPLVRAFAETLALGYAVALADAETIAGRGPFPGVHHVPAVVVLDRQGREVWRRLGLVEEAALEAELRKLER